MLSPLLFAASLAWLAPPPDPALVAAFSFDEGRGFRAADASGRRNLGSVRHAVWVAGVRGGALSFADPRAALRVPCRPWLKLGAQLALEAWINPPAPGEQSRIILAKNDEYLLRADKQSEGGRVSLFVQVGSPAVTWEPRASSLAPPRPHGWHHVAGTWDGQKLRLYLDGALQAECERRGLPNPNPYPVMIGNFEYPSCHGGNFGGAIDEVRIYSRALTAEEVRRHFEAERVGG